MSDTFTLTSGECRVLREWYFGDQYDDSGLMEAVERIIAARVAEAKAEAWEDGVKTALHFATRAEDGVTLLLSRSKYPNPYIRNEQDGDPSG
jgi:hypothetical protein